MNQEALLKTLHERIRLRLGKAADELYDPDFTLDSDGLDQAERHGIMVALAIVTEESV